MNRAACGVSPIAARTSATRLCRPASETNVPARDLEKVGLRYHFRSTIEEDLQESKRPGGKRNRPAMATQHMAHGVELTGPKATRTSRAEN